jgi:hypothetical protein
MSLQEVRGAYSNETEGSIRKMRNLLISLATVCNPNSSQLRAVEVLGTS